MQVIQSLVWNSGNPPKHVLFIYGTCFPKLLNTVNMDCVVPEKIHTHLMEGLWKFPEEEVGGGAGGLKKLNF